MSLRWEIFHVGEKYLEFKLCFIFPESILKTEDAIWISKDGRRLAFLKLNDTKVTSISYQKIDNSAEQPGSLKYAKVSSLAILLKAESTNLQMVSLMKYVWAGLKSQ